jgi:hypothetical protein
MLDARPLARVLTALMLVYFTLVNHVPLAPFNNLTAAGAQWRSTAVGVIGGGLVLLALASGSQVAVVFAAGWLWLWFALQLRQWWVPYLFGATAVHRDFGWYSAGGYDRTVRAVPLRAGRPNPDLQHLLLQILTVLAASLTSLSAGQQLYSSS